MTLSIARPDEGLPTEAALLVPDGQVRADVVLDVAHLVMRHSTDAATQDRLGAHGVLA